MSWAVTAIQHRGCVRHHVVPNDDLKEHDLDNDATCWCAPKEDDDGLIVHNSRDGRELYEEGLRKTS